MIQILNFFLRHLILLGLLAYLALGFYLHETLFPGVQLPKLPSREKPVQQPATGQPAEPGVTAVPGAIADPEAVSSPVPVSPVPTSAATVVAPAPAPPSPPLTDDRGQAKAPVDSYQFRPQESEPPAAPAAPAEAGDALYQAMMNQARSLVEKEDWVGAEAAYLRLTLEYADKAEPYGELGNLYLYRKEQAKAADAYWQAAQRLKGTGQSERLENLLEVLEQIAPEKAKGLREQLAKP